METSTNTAKTIDFRIILGEAIKRKRLYYKWLPIVFVVSCLYIICIPREYVTQTAMAPETENSGGGGMLSSLASSVGLDLSAMETSDAITPLLYPDLMNDNGFVASLFDIEVETADGSLKTNYFDYMKSHQESAWWSKVLNQIKSIFKTEQETGPTQFDPYYLSRRDDDVMNSMRNNIVIDIDKKTGVITVSVSAQDKMVCKIMADSVRSRLQEYITLYRTNKARNDFENYKQQAKQLKAEYDEAARLYSDFYDKNMQVTLQSYKSKLADLGNDMQLKYNSYSAMVAQMNLAQTKVQERTPAFTTLIGASVPIKPAKPKRMFFVLGMVFAAAFCLTIYSIKDYMFK